MENSEVIEGRVLDVDPSILTALSYLLILHGWLTPKLSGADMTHPLERFVGGLPWSLCLAHFQLVIPAKPVKHHGDDRARHAEKVDPELLA